MPACYQLDLINRMVRTRAWGVLTDDEVIELYASICADSEFKPSFRQLCDMREVTKITASAQTLRDLGQSQIFEHGTQRAFVVNRELDYGVDRLFQVYSEASRDRMEVFREWEAAEEWLGMRVRS